LAAAKRAADPLASFGGWADQSLFPPNGATVLDTLEGLAAAWGYIRLGGKDRRPSAAQVADLLTAAGKPEGLSGLDLEDEEMSARQLEQAMALIEQASDFLRREISTQLEILRHNLGGEF
jgi:hypothetical protein